MKFCKPPLSINDQINLLQRRGMAIPDRSKAEHYLKHVSYYRLRAYWLPFEAPKHINGDHCFKDNTSFDDVLSLYVFDRQLRLLVMDAIERIEVSLRGSWAHHMAMKYGAHGYLEGHHYSHINYHEKTLSALMKEIERARDTFINHYNKKYTDPSLPPIWMAAEIMSLGQLSKWISNLKLRADKQSIAKQYGLDQTILVSLLHHLTYVRNICAHHGRLWNKQFTVTMSTPNSPKSLAITINNEEKRLIYNTITLIGYLLSVIEHNNNWHQNVTNLVKSCAAVNPLAMGFPEEWRSISIWRSK